MDEAIRGIEALRRTASTRAIAGSTPGCSGREEVVPQGSKPVRKVTSANLAITGRLTRLQA